MSGDYYDLFPLPDGSWLICIADVVGHGIPAAMTAAMLKTLLHGQEQSEREQEQLRRDRLHIAVQKICPVSGQKLGEHGPPLKVTIGKQKEEVFLCCKGCLQQKIDPKHWATIHANFAEAQRICPIMKKPLPQNPKWTIVEGQIVYVCCPPRAQPFS